MLPDWDLGAAPEPLDPLAPVLRGGGFAAVCGGSLVAFSPAVSEGHRRDVLYALLLAQLVANKKFNRHMESGDWYRAYGDTLEQIGWTVKEHEGFSRYQSRRLPYRLGGAALRTLAHICDEISAALSVAALKTLAGLPDADRAAELFEKESHSPADRAGNFQVVVVDEIDGTVIARLGRFRFRAVDDATVFVRLLRTDFHRADEFLGGGQVLHLNDAVYGPLRDGIASKLGFRVDVLIVPLPALNVR